MNSQKSAAASLSFNRYFGLFWNWQIRTRAWLRSELGDARFYHIRHRAENGDALNQYRMGLLCEAGVRIPASDYDAHKWFLRAAFQGVVEAQAKISEYYRVGKGQPQNDEEAFKWCRKAAEQGFTPSQVQLIQMYREGIGVERNLNEAKKWQKRTSSADQPVVMETPAELPYAPIQEDRIVIGFHNRTSKFTQEAEHDVSLQSV